MTFEEYTQGCLKTWTPGMEKERVALALLEEIGEVAGKYKKFYRGDFGEDVLREGVLKELGDVLFYCAIGCSKAGVTVGNLEVNSNYDILSGLYDCSKRFADVIHSVGFNDDESFSESMVDMTLSMCMLIKACGFTVEEVMKANLAKLADRAKRNVIKGSGDNR